MSEDLFQSQFCWKEWLVFVRCAEGGLKTYWSECHLKIPSAGMFCPIALNTENHNSFEDFLQHGCGLRKTLEMFKSHINLDWYFSRLGR